MIWKNSERFTVSHRSRSSSSRRTRTTHRQASNRPTCSRECANSSTSRLVENSNTCVKGYGSLSSSRLITRWACTTSSACARSFASSTRGGATARWCARLTEQNVSISLSSASAQTIRLLLTASRTRVRSGLTPSRALSGSRETNRSLTLAIARSTRSG